MLGGAGNSFMVPEEIIEEELPLRIRNGMNGEDEDESETGLYRVKKHYAKPHYGGEAVNITLKQ